MTATLPFLTTYDPPGTSEGTLDPLGLCQIADQLAMKLVPAVRERMQRIRFLTAMAVGGMVTEGALRDNSIAAPSEAVLVVARRPVTGGGCFRSGYGSGMGIRWVACDGLAPL